LGSKPYMKIKELMEKLKAFDPETRLVVGGLDEEGYADIKRIELVKVAPRISQVEILGEYEVPKEGDKKEFLSAVLIDHG
jgi:hypothetical protein